MLAVFGSGRVERTQTGEVPDCQHHYELLDWQIDETMECLLDRAIEIGEQVSQGNIARGQGPAPFAHRACSAYHAIEIIRWYQERVKELEERLDEINSAAEDRRFE